MDKHFHEHHGHSVHFIVENLFYDGYSLVGINMRNKIHMLCILPVGSSSYLFLRIPYS